MTKPLTIGIVCAEPSGDALGVDFITKMNAIHPNITWVGVGGTLMQNAGLHSLIDMSRLSVMGLVEVIKHLPDLLSAKREILDAFFAQKIDIFVGIDAPDFNLRLGKTLKKSGVFCVQYVSPSIWAWRENRIHTIKEATDLVLCLFPFELDVYARHHHPAVCVGHPLLDKLHADPRPQSVIFDEFISNFKLPLSPTKTPICVMAGSRTSEINAILPLLIDSMHALDKQGDFEFILPVVSQEHATLIRQQIDRQAPHLSASYHIIVGHDGERPVSWHAMNASSLVILASGTATLEVLLLHRPMVVIYRLNALTYTIAKHLVKIPYVSLPNILSNHQTGKAIVPELIQDHATTDNITSHALNILSNSTHQTQSMANVTSHLRADSRHDCANSVLTHFFNQKNVV
ncbi:MAG: lipid-A-disaccharide synthase [Moraxella sp.]|uniref:lipid-A-disaccharide synthase n=1 Tax=Moraxella sp. TaxID=479 RepID=UPI0026DB0B0F|nr:lipid-A-disaccharide synthase [Moraxella sp.]MDO4451123.1 lipid-A-disaccharide synthase [Moraxella sp.]